MKKLLISLCITITLVTFLYVEPASALADLSISGPSLLNATAVGSYTISGSIYQEFSVRDYVVTLSSNGGFYVKSGASSWTHHAYNGNFKHTVLCGSSNPGHYTLTLSVTIYFTNGSSTTYSASSIVSVVKPSTPTPAPTAAPAPGPDVAPAPAPAATPTKKPARATATPTPNPNKPLNWGQAEFVINNSSDDEIKFSMRSSRTKITDDVLGLLQEQNKKLTVDFGDYSCTLDGSQIDNIPDGMNSLNIGFSTKQNKTISKKALGYDFMQLHFDSVGELPCPITYELAPPDLSAGDIVYVYHYDKKAERLQAIQRCIVNGDGYVDFTLFHYSSYILTNRIIIEAGGYDIFLATPTPTPSPTPTVSPTPSPIPSPTPKVTHSPTPKSTNTPLPTLAPTRTPRAYEENTIGPGVYTFAYILLFLGIALVLTIVIIIVVKKVSISIKSNDK